MNDTESRLSRLEGRDTAAISILSELLTDYKKLRDLLFAAQGDLRLARERKKHALRHLKECRDEYELEEASLLAVDERAKGRNLEERKNNAAFVISEERKPGAKLAGLWENYYTAQKEMDDAETNESIAIDYFSAVRYAARMTAAFAYSLGG